ncbi:hypothetical protein AB0C60_26665, partial [Streptomyces sp. NPDC048845]
MPQQPAAPPALDVIHRLVPSPAGRVHLVEQGSGPLRDDSGNGGGDGNTTVVIGVDAPLTGKLSALG